MSENSLIVRQKYISKLFDKVESLQEGIQLLEKVDRKIFKKNMFRTIQAGGAAVADNGISIKNIQGEALVTEAKLERQKEVIEKARLTIETLNNGLAGVRSSLEQLHKLMQDINDNINMKPLGNATLPDFSSYDKQTLYNAFKKIPYTDMVKVESDDTEKLYDLLKKAPSTFQKLPDDNKRIDKEEYNALLEKLSSASSPLLLLLPLPFHPPPSLLNRVASFLVSLCLKIMKIQLRLVKCLSLHKTCILKHLTTNTYLII